MLSLWRAVMYKISHLLCKALDPIKSSLPINCIVLLNILIKYFCHCFCHWHMNTRRIVVLKIYLNSLVVKADISFYILLSDIHLSF